MIIFCFYRFLYLYGFELRVERQCTLKRIVSVFSVGNCRPVCAQGCEPYGVCVAPDVCRCHFGYVGNNCSTECQCNRHSNCRSVDETDECLQCRNHTQVGSGVFPAFLRFRVSALSFHYPRSPSVLLSPDLQICTQPTCHGILGDGIRKKYIFQPEVFFSNLQTSKYTPAACIPSWHGVPGCDPFASRYVCHIWNVHCAHFVCLSGSPRSFFANFTTFNAYLCVFMHLYFFQKKSRSL